MLRSWELSKEEKTPTEIEIRDMAKLSLISNKISDVQEKNLKMYPFVFFNGVKAVKIDYDLSNNQLVDTEETRNTKEDVEKGKEKLEIKFKFNQAQTNHLRVSYYLLIDSNTENDHADKRYKAIENSVRNLFWKETRVEVYINDKLMYESKNV